MSEPARVDYLAVAIRERLTGWTERLTVTRLHSWMQPEDDGDDWLVLDGTERSFLPVRAEDATRRLGPTLHGSVNDVGWRIDLPEVTDRWDQEMVLRLLTTLGYPQPTDTTEESADVRST